MSPPTWRDWPIRTPDLASRLSAATMVALDPPDEALIEALLTKHFHDRRLLVGAEVIRFLSRRIERSAAAALGVVERLDAEALREGRTISLPFVKEITGL
ncbi:MAG: HdaA/DnaA family protein [Pikeienuella sp.]